MDNNTETAKYPYQPGEKGVPFEELLERVGNGESKGAFVGGSGRALDYSITEDSIKITDEHDLQYEMEATCRDGVAEFTLFTNVVPPDAGNSEARVRHPDMFAAKFVSFALQYFKSKDMDVKACKDLWYPPDSDNLDTFKEIYGKTHDKVQAAKATWSAKVFAQNGYTEINEEDIQIDTLLNSDHAVTANFSRKDPTIRS